MPNDHNRIIRNAAKAVLAAEGLFQMGRSRVWIEDNGWYLTVVEFQPSGWSKGSYLNVAICFLWDNKEYLSYDYPGASNIQVGGFTSFEGNEDEFLQKIHAMAETALSKVKEYRRLRDLECAKASIVRFQGSHILHSLYAKLMVCGLCRDPMARDYFDQLLEQIPRLEREWVKPYYAELTERIAPILDDPDRLYDYICEKIRCQRAFWRSKPNMKKLRNWATEVGQTEKI